MNHKRVERLALHPELQTGSAARLDVRMPLTLVIQASCRVRVLYFAQYAT
jgi:hypothetical protein